MSFEFATAGRIVFGLGVFQQAGKLISEAGKHALVAYGVQNESLDRLFNSLSEYAVEITAVPVNKEPTVEDIQQGIEIAKRHGCDIVISLGGGSALDAGKAIAGLLTNPGDIYDYLEIVGGGRVLEYLAAPFMAIPTTAGTGSEVTRNAVLSAKIPDQSVGFVKVSLRSAYLLPRIALVDPELTISLPPQLTATTGLDALTQVIEPFLSNKANPLTDGICREGIIRAAHALPRAFRQGEDLSARIELSLASLFGGLALANAKLGAVHGFAAVLGGMYDAPHGAICARLLPIVMETNLQAILKREPDNPARQRLDEVGRLLTGSQQAVALDGVQWLHDLCSDLHISGLAAYGMTPSDFSKVADQAARASSMQGNPILLTGAELIEILAQAL